MSMPRATVVGMLCLAACACATKPMAWVRVDGKPITETQLAVDQTVCRGEMQKANLSSTAEAGFGRGRAVVEVYVGCMAQRGYMQVAAGP